MEKNEILENKIIERIEYLIDYVMEQNLCENDTKTYLNYLDKDLIQLQIEKITNKDECLINHCIEEIVLLQQIIEIIKGVN